jgi:hypothetical protein
MDEYYDSGSLLINNKDISSHAPCSFDEMKDIIWKIPNSSDIYSKINENKFTEVESRIFLQTKRKRENGYNMVEENRNENSKRRGRVPKENTRPKSIHNNYASNNVMVKVKSKILDYLLAFINNMINNRKEDQKKLIKLDYKYIENVNRDFNLNMLNMKLKDFLSMDITRKKKVKK